MKKKIVDTKKSPAAIGPYSQGNIAGGLLFTSGQLPIKPKTGIVPSSIEEQNKQVMDNLKALVEIDSIAAF
ncbi:MAG: Rid family hydrolase [Bacteroidales bacterium]